MINSAITPIITYALCSIKLHRGVIDNIDRIRKQCLWRGNTNKIRGNNLVAWELVQKPKDKGGLGVINLRLQNDALLLKQLHKFYNRMDVPQVQQIWFKYYQNKVPHTAREVGSFQWKDILRLHNLYRGITHCVIGNGATACFQEDNQAGEILAEKFPRLASFAKSTLISVQEMVLAEDLDSMFVLPFSQAALDELLQLQQLTENIPFDESLSDTWLTIWGGNYTSSKFYNHIFQSL